MKGFLAFIVCLFLSVPLLANIYAQTAVVYPIEFINYDNSSRKAILQSHVEGQVAGQYRLKTKQEVATAIEAARDSLPSDNCTEDACIKKINSVLGVAFSYQFKIIVDGKYWDITTKRVDDFGQASLKNQPCVNCDITKARKILSQMITGSGSALKEGQGKLFLKSSPSGAQVFINGNSIGNTPLETNVTSGEPIDVTIVSEGYSDYTTVFNVKKGQELKPPLIQLPKMRAKLTLTSDPTGAQIFFDGKPLLDGQKKLAKTPYSWRPTFGKHTIRLVKANLVELKEEIEINTEEMGTLSFSMGSIPGKVLLKVPTSLREGDVFVDGKVVGNMDSKAIKSFIIPSDKTVEIYVESKNVSSNTKLITVQPKRTKSLTLAEGDYKKRSRQQPTRVKTYAQKDSGGLKPIWDFVLVGGVIGSYATGVAAKTRYEEKSVEAGNYADLYAAETNTRQKASYAASYESAQEDMARERNKVTLTNITSGVLISIEAYRQIFMRPSSVFAVQNPYSPEVQIMPVNFAGNPELSLKWSF
ncbi:MAG: PEGA domain-containing protein [SAR324 cluster bacterium]|nr:PEGA domain-containing protein [SAR324 cluster bacterium]